MCSYDFERLCESFMSRSRDLDGELGTGRVHPTVRRNVHDRSIEHPLDDDGRAVPYRDPRRRPEPLLQHSQPAHVPRRSELLYSTHDPRRNGRNPVVLCRRVDTGVNLRLHRST